MRGILRISGTVLVLFGVMFLIFALTNVGGPKSPSGGELSCRLLVKDKLISGAYKVYGLKDQAASIWLAKTVFKNDTGGMIRNLRVRYRLGEYADWCSWYTYPSLVPTETVVDLYHPLLSSKCAELTARTPAELEMECDYIGADGKKNTIRKGQRLSLLSRFEFYFTNLKTAERTGSFQDFSVNSPMLASWVTPSDQAVTGLAGLANERARGAGAHVDDKSCLLVMKELYEIMRAINITYQSPAYQLEQNKSFDTMLLQTLQYPRDTIRKRSGTCIDLAILYAAMMHSVGIKPLLITLDGHCFPIGVTPNGLYVPVEATCVGGGGKDSNDFKEAVEIAQKQWKELQKTGRFVVVDCQASWAAGISPPELPPLPADILDRWKITEMLKTTPPAGNGAGTTDTNVTTAAKEYTNNWVFGLTQPNGTKLQGISQVTVRGNKIQFVFDLKYPVVDHDGITHQAHERNIFMGTMTGQQIRAQCRQAAWTFDGQPVQPQGLPYGLQLTVASNGKSAQGTVTNANGMSTQLFMQAK